MVRQGQGGKIIVISSAQAEVPVVAMKTHEAMDFAVSSRATAVATQSPL